MKKIISICLFVVLLFCFAACGDKIIEENKIPLADEYEWVMRYTQKTGGKVVAYGSDKYSQYDNAKEIEMTATAKDGIIIISDITNDKSYEVDRTPESQNYKFNVYGVEGFGMTAMTKYYNGETYYETPTMIIQLGEYTLTFEAVQE